MSSPSAANSTMPHSSFVGGDFSNNLLSDLAPLLTLFGEQVMKQFLSLSMGWADNILLALGPLGIMTTIVSAIRVGGHKLLKAIVGRAREGKSAAEAELLSSTSHEVCEMWNGEEVVRTFSVPRTYEIVIVHTESGALAYSLHDAYIKEFLVEASGQDFSFEEMWLIALGAPNLTLNVLGSTVSNSELWVWVIGGVIAQLVALILPAVMTYYWSWTAASYGYPCFSAGSLAIIVGLMLSSHTIEGSTTEYLFVPNPDKPTAMSLVCLQRTTIVSEQRYHTYFLPYAANDVRIQTSRLNRKDYSKICALSTSITLIGFVSQFIALRALHWSATVLSLGVTILMICVRAWVRRGLASTPKCFKPPQPPHDLPWLAMWIEHCFKDVEISGTHLDFPDRMISGYDMLHNSTASLPPSFLPHFEVMKGAYRSMQTAPEEHNVEYSFPAYTPQSPACFPTNPSDARLVKLLVSMQSIVPRTCNKAYDVAEQLLYAITTIMSSIYSNRSIIWKAGSRPDLKFSFDLFVTRFSPQLHGSTTHSASVHMFEPRVIRFNMSGSRNVNDNPYWTVDASMEDLHAILSLWIYSIRSRGLTEMGPLSGKMFLRIIGCAPPSEILALLKRLSMWLDVYIVRCRRPDGRSRSQFPVIYPHPIFVCRYSSVFHEPKKTGCDYFSKAESMSNSKSLEKGSCGESTMDTDIGVLTRSPLEVHCALDIVSAFMATLSPLILHLGGTVEMKLERTTAKAGSFSRYVYKNSTVEDLIDWVMKRSPLLFPTRQNAEAILIPAFFHNNLLNTEIVVD